MKAPPIHPFEDHTEARPCGNEALARGKEDELVAEAKGGSIRAFEQLVNSCEARVFRVAQSIARSREDAEEVMQDAFIKAFEKLSHFRGDSRFYTWLVRITINEGLMKVRRRRWNEISMEDAFENEDGALPRQLEDWGPNPEQRYSQKELQDILANAIGQLAPGYRTVFQLRDVEGFSTEETARSLNLSIPTIKTRVRRARFQLRQSLNEFFKPRNEAALPERGFRSSFWEARRLRSTRPGPQHMRERASASLAFPKTRWAKSIGCGAERS
ncbi:MAG TPA: sigma-70 family RNA polymerase sigma factor [Verrucomicrobiae bacterium]|nr:sigma-70 family RNA polymerase sigma factor [Verrucomicrobiae bacterium]